MRIFFCRPNSGLVVAPPPASFGYLSHALKTRRGDEVRIVDGRARRLPAGSIVEMARGHRPDFIGVTSMTYEAPEALGLIDLIKRELPHVPVAIGGPHATGFGPELLDRCAADYLVSGEGEDTLIELLDALETGGSPEKIAGLAHRAGGEVVFNGKRDTPVDPASLDIDWEEIDPRRYFSSWRRNAMNTVAISERRLPVFFSRGCPFGCAYCHQIFGRRYRAFPVEKAVGRMVELRDRYRLREFEIIDDTFNLSLKHAKLVMRHIIESDLDCALTFTNGLRADRMDEELLELMKQAGVYRIDYAVETASPRIQEDIHKNLDLARAREVINMTAARGIVTGVYYIIGFPGETRQEMEATVEYAVTLDNHISSFFYLMAFPGTEIAERDPAVAKLLRDQVFRDASSIALNLSAEPDRVLEEVRKSAYRRFYFSPRRMLRIARDVPKNPRLAAAALAITRLAFQEEVDY